MLEYLVYFKLTIHVLLRSIDKIRNILPSLWHLIFKTIFASRKNIIDDAVNVCKDGRIKEDTE